jgi:hypothetical protein
MIDTDAAPLALTLPDALDAAGGRHPATAAIFPEQHTGRSSQLRKIAVVSTFRTENKNHSSSHSNVTSPPS